MVGHKARPFNPFAVPILDAHMHFNASLRRNCDVAAQRLQDALARHFLLSQKYSPNQPRVPAGNPDGGQWASQQEPGSFLDEVAQGLENTRWLNASVPLQLAGGFEKEDMGTTVQQFVSENCKGNIREVLPSQFDLHTIAEVLALAKSGDRAAMTCKKLLGRERFRKGK